jgi:hypothetical protein
MVEAPGKQRQARGSVLDIRGRHHCVDGTIMMTIIIVEVNGFDDDRHL